MRERTIQKIAFVLLSVLTAGAIAGCFSLEPTYTKEKAAQEVIALCQREYGLKINAWMSGNTLYVYLPVPSLTSSDPEIQQKINRTLICSTRVCLSMKPRMDFLKITIADIKQHGLEYSVLNYVPDIVKLQLNALSRDNFTNRTIVNITQNPQALEDEEGIHLDKSSLTMSDFICAQIAQRLSYAVKGQAKDNKTTLPPKKVAAVSLKNRRLEIQTLADEEKNIPAALDFKRRALEITALMVKEYEFRDFDDLEIILPESLGGESLFSRKAIAAYSK